MIDVLFLFTASLATIQERGKQLRLTFSLDLQPNNIPLGIKDAAILSKYEEAELEDPVSRKITSDYTIYLSQPVPISYGTPVVSDFGKARLGTEEHKDDIMPDIYRAPEVILNMS